MLNMYHHHFHSRKRCEFKLCSLAINRNDRKMMELCNGMLSSLDMDEFHLVIESNYPCTRFNCADIGRKIKPERRKLTFELILLPLTTTRTHGVLRSLIKEFSWMFPIFSEFLSSHQFVWQQSRPFNPPKFQHSFYAYQSKKGRTWNQVSRPVDIQIKV